MLPLRTACAVVACAGTAIAAVAFVAAHIGATGWTDVTIGAALVLDRGVALEVALVAAGLSGLALAAGLRAAGAPVGGWPGGLLTGWGAATALLGVAPAGTPDLVVGALSAAVFLTLPAATALLVPVLRRDDRLAGAARPMEWLALAQGLGLVAITYVALPGHGVMIGLVERLLLGAEVAAAGVLAVRMLQVFRTMPSRPAGRGRIPLVGRS